MRHLRIASALALAGVTVLAVTGTTLASHRPASTAKYGTLTVNITLAGGTVWGKVSIAPLKKTCTVKKCTYKVKLGTKLTLTETPVDSATWPFSKWVLNKKSAGSKTTLKFKMGKSDTVTAVYVLPPSSGTLTVNITSTGTVWGTVHISPLGKTCNAAQCTYNNVPLNATETASETATDSGTWPFGGWTLNGNSKGTATSVQFTTSTKDTLTANYCDGHC